MTPTMTPTRLLSRRFASVRRRFVAIGGASGVCWGVAAAVALVAAAFWLDLIWDLPPEARVAAWGVVLAIVVAVPAVWLGRAWRWAGNASLARRLDATGGTPGTIAAGWHLAKAAGLSLPAGLSSPAGLSLSAGLASIAIQRAEHDAAGVSAARVAPVRAARPGAIAACVGAAAVACFAVIAPEMAATEWQRFVHPFDDVAPYSPVTILVEPGNARVAYGAGLDVHVRTEGPPVERVNLVLRAEDGSEELLPMFADGQGDYRTTLASIITPARYFVRADMARSKIFRIDVITVPTLEKLHVRIAPPAYTRMPPYEGPLPPDGITGLAGTRVTMRATSNRPLSGGTLRIAGSRGDEVESVSLVPIAPNADTAAGSFTITEPGTFELRVTDVDGEPSVDTASGGITVTPDHRPFVRLLRPLQASLAVPTAIIPVQWAAEDDYGVSRLTLFRSLNASQWLPLDLPITLPPERRACGAIDLPLAAYRLEPGDEICLFVRAEDNDPAQPKGAESSISRIRIISQAEFDAMIERQYTFELLASKYRQVQRRLAALAAKNDRLRKAMADKPADSEIDPADREALDDLAKALAKDIKELKAVAAIALPFDLDQKLSEDLARHLERLEKAAQALGGTTGAPSLSVAELTEALDALAKQLEDADSDVAAAMMAPIEHLESVMPLIAAEATFLELVRRQRDLAERIDALEGEANPDEPASKVRLRDLAAEQADIRTRLDELLTEIEERANQLPDDPGLDKLRDTARWFAEDVRDTFVLEDMASAESSLAKPDVPLAVTAATTAADKLDAFVKRCEGGDGMRGQGSMCLGFAPSLCKPMQATIGQLLAMMKGSGGSGSGMTGLGQTGMYGQLPVSLGLLGGSGESDAAADGMGGSSSPGGAETPNTITAFGASTSAPNTRHEAPAAYRRRVADYFRRLAEELEETP